MPGDSDDWTLFNEWRRLLGQYGVLNMQWVRERRAWNMRWALGACAVWLRVSRELSAKGQLWELPILRALTDRLRDFYRIYCRRPVGYWSGILDSVSLYTIFFAFKHVVFYPIGNAPLTNWHVVVPELALWEAPKFLVQIFPPNCANAYLRAMNWYFLDLQNFRLICNTSSKLRGLERRTILNW
jgi:hypothetical protein